MALESDTIETYFSHILGHRHTLGFINGFFYKATTDILTFFALFFGISGHLYRPGSKEYVPNISNNKEELSTELMKPKKT